MLVAWLSLKEPDLCRRAFPQVIDIVWFSDLIFEVIANFSRGVHDGEHWVAAIEAVDIQVTEGNFEGAMVSTTRSSTPFTDLTCSERS